MTKLLTTVSHRDFCERLAGKLSRCWLRDEYVVWQHIERILVTRQQWLRPLARAISLQFGEAGYARPSELGVWLTKQPNIRGYFGGRKTRKLSLETVQSLALDLRLNHRWNVPPLDTEEELCRMLDLPSMRCLEWLVLPHVRRTTRVDHYRRWRLRKPGGGFRWLEEPLPQLKAAQRRILDAILSRIPLHTAAYAYRPGVSVADCAEQHLGKR